MENNEEKILPPYAMVRHELERDPKHRQGQIGLITG
jgi:hypothetical protein